MLKKMTEKSPPALPSVQALINSLTQKKDFPTLIDDKKLAELFDIDERTPAQWRYTGKYKKELPVIRIGRCCRYRLADAIALIEQQLTGDQS
ncbi:MAG: hypothetical protein ACRCWJ_18860 [Casimicrobium sp.]